MLIWLLIAASLAAPSPADASRPFRVLVTGDSMVEPLDSQLGPVVKRAGGRLARDPRPGTGITRPLTLDWVRHAKKQARRYRPQATVMFIGANDSGSLRPDDGPEVECCRRAWIDAYADRVERMMRAYQRRSDARVYWLTLPMPRGEEHRPRFLATNFAISQAAEAVGDDVSVVDTVPLLSPGNSYRRTVRYRGRTVVVRDKDGVHLTKAGSGIARDLVVRAMRADGLI